MLALHFFSISFNMRISPFVEIVHPPLKCELCKYRSRSVWVITSECTAVSSLWVKTTHNLVNKMMIFALVWQFCRDVLLSGPCISRIWTVIDLFWMYTYFFIFYFNRLLKFLRMGMEKFHLQNKTNKQKLLLWFAKKSIFGSWKGDSGLAVAASS